MSMKKEIGTDNVGTAPTLSQAIETNGMVFVSGQIHADKNWKLQGKTVKEKLDVIFENIRLILVVAELELNDIVKATIYVTDMAQIPELNQHYSSYFSGVLPAREAVCVKELPLGATIEISVIAAR
ncbi:Endoribonuclease L-PSP [Candidatus Saccharibacteria bacterium RAAC3_TM7_1]|nr:Endoribonuclease L-PSP [Candidatus Saccharibacteria bacterium RAAC3_TM7_1]HCZ28402.1 reactive intermediate/imine deaminase [Candidatus Saccharibacteria bacterium]